MHVKIPRPRPTPSGRLSRKGDQESTLQQPPRCSCVLNPRTSRLGGEIRDAETREALQRVSRNKSVGNKLEGRRGNGRVESGMGPWLNEMEKGEMGEQPRDSEKVARRLVGSFIETGNAGEKATGGKRIYVQVW